MSRLAKHAIDIEKSTPIINYVIERLKAEKEVLNKYKYFYFLNPDMSYEKNSFEEKSISAAICFKSNLSLEKASVALILMRTIHNETHDFFSNPANNPRKEDWYDWLCGYVKRDIIQVEYSENIIPFLGIRKQRYQVEIYTLENIWDVRHSRNYR